MRGDDNDQWGGKGADDRRESRGQGTERRGGSGVI